MHTRYLYFLLLSFPLLAQTLPKAIDQSSIIPRITAKTTDPGYVGANRCQSCHKAEATMFGMTKHSKIKGAHADSIMGCEICHGPGKAHAEGVESARGDDTKIAAAAKLIYAFRGNPKEIVEKCQTCHATSKEQSLFARSSHSMQGVSCIQCHSTHLVDPPASPTFAMAKMFSVPRLAEQNRWLTSSLLKKSQPDLCAGCHKTIQAQFALPSHHRVPEGLVKCTDCHTPHGSANRTALRQSSWESCVKCHTEKRGPYVFEHSAVKVEGCLACHTPHGSVNKLLLTRREERTLCLQCHVNPFAANVPHGKGGFTTRGDCSRCHVSIHGSNFSEYYIQ